MLTPEPTESADAGREAPAPLEEREDTLLTNTGWLLATRLGQALLGWGGTLLIARSLSIDEFGRFTLIFTILGMMSLITDMGIGRIALRGMVGEFGGDAGHFAGAYIALRTLLGLVGYVLVLVVVLALGYPGDVVAGTAVAGIVILLATPSSALDVIFQSRMRMRLVGVASVGGLVAQFALTAAIAAGGGTLLLFTIPAVLCEVVILALKVPAARRLLAVRLIIDVALWRRLLREAIPLTLGIGLATLYYRVDAVMLSQLDTFAAVGAYGVSYKFIDIVHFAAVAVTVPLLTVLVRSWPHDLTTFHDAVRRSTMLLGILGGVALVGLLGYAEPLTTNLFGADYAIAEHATRVLVVAQVLTLLASLALTVLIAVDSHRTYPFVMLGGLAVNITANALLIPRYSFEGAAAATLGSEILVLGLLVVLVRRVPGLWPSGLARLLLVPLAVGGALGVGWATDLVLPWVVSAACATVVFLGLATLGGLTSAAGLVRPLRKDVGP